MPKALEWVPIEELPGAELQGRGVYLAAFEDGTITEAYYYGREGLNGKRWDYPDDFNAEGEEPTHWMFVPAPNDGRRKEDTLSEFKTYRKKQLSEMRPYVAGEDMAGVSVSEPDKTAGSPKAGDMIAQNPKDHGDRWLVSAQFFADNFEPA